MAHCFFCAEDMSDPTGCANHGLLQEGKFYQAVSYGGESWHAR